MCGLYLASYYFPFASLAIASTCTCGCVESRGCGTEEREAFFLAYTLFRKKLQPAYFVGRRASGVIKTHRSVILLVNVAAYLCAALPRPTDTRRTGKVRRYDHARARSFARINVERRAQVIRVLHRRIESALFENCVVGAGGGELRVSVHKFTRAYAWSQEGGRAVGRPKWTRTVGERARANGLREFRASSRFRFLLFHLD